MKRTSASTWRGRRDLPIGLVDLRAFQAGKVRGTISPRRQGGAAAVLLDGIDAAMLQQAGQLIWELRAECRSRCSPLAAPESPPASLPTGEAQV